ncbi:ABC transporter permease [Variovorax terrae]|uniref:ABC transporter permease n=1 Tax=Variovorax terrae TaxID=2923278 RepID=A0A9X1VSN0_9BURK|nr:ABC transporter permease [Variovorax terrae]MCJ0763091.1 ABC transporter permease [Variovorax terrae]
MPQCLRNLLRAWGDTLRAIGGDFGVLLILAAAPVLYGFFYPWPYAQQAVTRVPVAVVDYDHSSLSRQITRFAQASPRIDVRWVGGNEHDAQLALWRGEIEGYAVLPRDLKRDVLRGSPAVVTVQADGAYALLNKAVLYGFAEAAGTVSAGIEIKKLQARGQSAPQAMASRSPINVQMVALFNPTEGYGSYVVPAVALLIIQQTLLMGAAMLVGTWAETGRHRAGLSAWAGRLLGLCSVGYLSGLAYFGWIFLVQDFPRGGNPAGALVLLAFYVPAVCTLGALLGVWFGNRERALQVLLFTALPMAFVSGFSWPAEALPAPLQALRWLFPSTAGIQASLRLNQMGAPLGDVAGLLAVLLGLAVVSGLALAWKTRPALA